ncbi:MAG: DUF2231 domain-containing protein [Saprospiraceae bacterium]|nr:hypothetical protein [Saprospiraceae bacterium]
MNGAHWHLVLNHLPIIIPMAGLILLMIAIFSKNLEYSRAAYLLFVVGALATLPAFLTGEGAEETIEGLNGIDEAFIHRHEEAAELFSFTNYALGLVALIAFWASYFRQQWSQYMKYLVLMLALVVLYTAKQAGTTGGEIRHTEIRDNTVVGTGNGGESHEEGDDD